MKSLILFALISFQAHAISFEEANRIASENSHELKILQLESQSADYGLTKAFSGYLPTLEVDGRHLFDEKFETLEMPFGGQNIVMPAIQPYTAFGITAKLNIFDGLRTTNDLRAARSAKTAADYRLKRAQEQKHAEIRTLFYRALGSQILVNVADQNIQTLQSHLNEVTSRIRSGVSTKFDSLRVEVQLEDAKTEKTGAESLVVVARSRLFAAIGIPDDGKPLDGKMPEDFSNVNIDKLDWKVEERTDRQALIAEREQQNSLSRAAQAHWMPQVALFSNYEWYNNTTVAEPDGRYKSAYALGVQFSWNLFDGGASYASQRQAALANQIAEEKVEKLERDMPANLEEAKRRFSYDVIAYNAKLSSIRKAEEAVRLAKSGLRAGARTNTEVLDAVVDLNRAKAAAVKAQIDALEALGQLELSVGHTL